MRQLAPPDKKNYQRQSQNCCGLLFTATLRFGTVSATIIIFMVRVFRAGSCEDPLGKLGAHRKKANYVHMRYVSVTHLVQIAQAYILHLQEMENGSH